ncbi:hypothetical protein A5753_02710 [Mycobacterium sp. 852002-51971_SCH5477799-a]|nr:hypothetical protein A5753_02710 [Mycobacterium sp. 852002-51971_SCH5477799-a]
MVTLGAAPGILFDGFLTGCTVHARGVVQGIAHSRSGKFRRDGFESGTRLRSKPAAQLQHAVGLLITQDQAALPGAVLVAEVAVGVEAVGQDGGQLVTLFGPILGAFGGEFGLRLLAGGSIYPAGQLVVELANDCDLTGPERAVSLRGRGGGQHRRQRFAGQSPSRTQVGGFSDAAGCLGAADQCRLCNRMRQRAAQLLCGGLTGERVDQRMLHRRHASAQLLAAF